MLTFITFILTIHHLHLKSKNSKIKIKIHHLHLSPNTLWVLHGQPSISYLLLQSLIVGDPLRSPTVAIALSHIVEDQKELTSEFSEFEQFEGLKIREMLTSVLGALDKKF
ncbi:hypothetical protein MTR_4g063685 [Medicago truncatula]|uniref:Uncharacterized protein n=1 Tax=Medicago truncatula TaxID=3880 RepID=A0A072UL38_MEDTR|nr:hypothetical protein MTR_4g063685 [Medicago truncatula]